MLAPVHRSYVDTPIAGCVTRRRLRFMGKDTMWKKRQVGWLLSALGGFPVTRGTADREALQRASPCSRAASRWCCSRRASASPARLVQPLFDGAVYIAVKAGVPIVPVGIGGSER